VADFPASPISPQEFFESFIPTAYAEADLPDGIADLDFKLGVLLEGQGGGQWLLHLAGGSLSVEPGSRKGAVVTLLQSVDDWRGALWQGRGGTFGRGITSFFRPGAVQAAEAPPPKPGVLEQLETLAGSIELRVTGGEGGAWSATVALGSGEIPAEPTTTLTVSEADSEALEKGELDPLQAFMSGRIQIGGDMSLLMQLQAVSTETEGA
jgi:putative sterol carrier protein